MSGLRRSACGTLIAIAMIVVSLGLATVWLRLEGAPRFDFVALVAVVAVVVSLVALWFLWSGLRSHFHQLERLRGGFAAFVEGEAPRLPDSLGADPDTEIRRLHALLVDLAVRRAEARSRPDRRLEAILAGIPNPVLVITEQGQVSLVNAPARGLLGSERVQVGTSVFAALKRPSLVAAVEAARAAGGPLSQTLELVEGGTLTGRVVALAEHGGAVLSFPLAAVESSPSPHSGGGLEHDLGLHDEPPEGPPASAETPLLELPVLVLDTETTGLDVRGDRVVSIGAVRLHGRQVFRSRSLDILVNPGQAIPPKSTAIHGITDAMVLDAEAFPNSFARLGGYLAGCVMIGHNIAFDAAVLRAECQRAGLDWPDPPLLDTLLLAYALEPQAEGYNLEDLAQRYAVDIHGRHTALGDSLVTAEIYTRMIGRLAEEGVTTYGQALAFSQRASAILRQQREAGW